MTSLVDKDFDFKPGNSSSVTIFVNELERLKALLIRPTSSDESTESPTNKSSAETCFLMAVYSVFKSS